MTLGTLEKHFLENTRALNKLFTILDDYCFTFHCFMSRIILPEIKVYEAAFVLTSLQKDSNEGNSPIDVLLFSNKKVLILLSDIMSEKWQLFRGFANHLEFF